MLAALAAHDIATVIRLLQDRGMSQRAIAARTGQMQSEIAEVLAGRRVRAYDVLTRFADGLGIPRAYMGLAGIPVPRRRTSRLPGGADPTISRPERDHAAQHHEASSHPPGLAVWWWNEPAMVAALATHDFAAVFAHLCQNGLTTDDLATHTGLPSHDIESIASGAFTIDSYRALVRLCDWLSIPRERVGVASTSPDNPQTQPELPEIWTGRHVRALRHATRLSVRDFARMLDVSDRSISKWEALGAATTPLPRNQQLLDIVLHRLEPAAQAVYRRLLHQTTDSIDVPRPATALRGIDRVRIRQPVMISQTGRELP